MADSRRHLNFDEWRALASSDPEGFEEERRRALDAVIARAPEKRRQRLRGLQWKVDQVRGHSPTPLAACISLSGMMWESFAGENGLIDALNGHLRSPYQRQAGRDSGVVPMRKDQHKPS